MTEFSNILLTTGAGAIADGNMAAVNLTAASATLRATTGISVRDIERYGIFGGPNSFFRKPFG